MTDQPALEPGGLDAAPEPAPAAPQRAASRRRVTGSDIIAAITEGRPAVVYFLAFVVALVVGGLLIVFSDATVLHAWSQFFSNPLGALSAAWNSISAAYVALFEGSVFNPATVAAAFHGGSVGAIFYPLSLTVFEATPLILTGLAVAVAFRAGLFNIGGNGQFIAGAMVATWLGVDVHLPVGIHLVVCVIGGTIGGAVLGWLVGLLKARTGAHEVIVTIMLNYVMVYLLAYLLNTPAGLQAPKQTNAQSALLDPSAQFPHVGGPPPQAGLGFLIAVVAAGGLAWLLDRSTVGFRFRTVGANPSAARAAGISVEGAWIWAMLIGGGLAGLAGAAVMQGQANNPLSNSSFGTYGFDGITVALLGRARPWGVVLAGLLWGALQAGGTNMAGRTQVPSDIVQVIQGLVVLFVAAPPLIRAIFRLRSAEGGMESIAKGWNG